MRAINRKLLRDLLNTKAQSLAISLVIASGLAMFIMSLSTLESLRRTQERYYQRYRFAHVFARLKRAPESLAERISEIDGIAHVQTRVVHDVTLDLKNLPEPAVGRLISLPDRPEEGLNQVFLRAGRYVEANRGEVLINEAFADVHQLEPGDTVTAILNGRKQTLRIVGVALSPEYVLQIREGTLLPDEKRFGVFWMHREELAAAFDMDGAFNDLVATLLRGASVEEVIARIDDLTEEYGGIGAVARKDQLSHRYLSDEMSQLRSMGIVAPAIFYSVAAFLLNVVLSRIVRMQREQIAALKAFGYNRFEVGWHYLKFVLVITAIGMVIGTVGGVYMGRKLTSMYTRFYKFPVFEFVIQGWIFLFAYAISLAAATLGTIASVRRAMRLPPAEAMRPEPPARYRPTLFERTGMGRLLSPTARMILRNVERQPLKAGLSCIGIAMAVSVLILGSFMLDSLNYIILFQFNLSQRYDMNVAFVEPLSRGSIFEIAHLPGVLWSEPFRAVPAKLKLGPRNRRVGIMGIEPQGTLFCLYDENEKRITVPDTGIMLSDKLAELLDAELDDELTVEILEGNRPIRKLRVTAIITEFGGANAYMNVQAISRLMNEDNALSGVFLNVDELHAEQLYRTLKETPKVASVTVKEASLRSFRETIAENLLAMRAFNIMFACVIAFGVVYNNARIALSERSRELATLRVIGFTRGEISRILLGELGIVTAVAIPLGMILGYGFAYRLTAGLDTEVYRIPLVINPSTYAFAAVVVVIATIVSGLSVRNQLNKLDLVAVLKTRE